MLEESHYYFNKASDLLSLSERVREILITPRRVVDKRHSDSRRSFSTGAGSEG